jgi:ribosome assembly protein YihI (activator of Der GTPase)
MGNFLQMSSCVELEQMNRLLDRLRAGELSVPDFSRHVRALTALRQELPARYDEVLLALLDRMESGALFTEESCSFSVKELHDSLGQWLAKAKEQLKVA